jgi:DNA-binding MarR family transcriptional regulator
MTTPSLSRPGRVAPARQRQELRARHGVPSLPPAGDDQAVALLLALGRLLRGHRHGEGLPRRLRARFANGALAPRHVGALAVVALYGPLTVSELASREGLALSTASLLVTQLSEAGLVERSEDPDDRRRTVVSVAPAFRRESLAALESKLAPIRRALVRMGTRRATAMLEGLAVLVEEIGGGGEMSSGADGMAPHDPEEGSR